MPGRVLEAGVPFAWFTGDEVYGSDRNLRLWLEGEEFPHLIAIKSDEKLWSLTDKGPLQVRADRLAPALGNPPGSGAAPGVAPRAPGL